MKTLVKEQLKKMARPAIRKLHPPMKIHSKPLSVKWGSDRGTPIARYYIDRFIEQNRAAIQGAVLEVKDRRYTSVCSEAVEVSDVLDIDRSNTKANIYADIADAAEVPAESYDCVILTETLQYVYELKEAVNHLHRILKPGGVLLLTVPCTAPMDSELGELELWRFTAPSCRRLFGDRFGQDNVSVVTYGNYASCTAWLAGMAAEEVEPTELLDEVSPMFVQGIGVRAQKVAE